MPTPQHVIIGHHFASAENAEGMVDAAQHAFEAMREVAPPYILAIVKPDGGPSILEAIRRERDAYRRTAAIFTQMEDLLQHRASEAEQAAG